MCRRLDNIIFKGHSYNRAQVWKSDRSFRVDRGVKALWVMGAIWDCYEYCLYQNIWKMCNVLTLFRCEPHCAAADQKYTEKVRLSPASNRFDVSLLSLLSLPCMRARAIIGQMQSHIHTVRRGHRGEGGWISCPVNHTPWKLGSARLSAAGRGDISGTGERRSIRMGPDGWERRLRSNRVEPDNW